MNPSEIISELKSETDFTEDEGKAFLALTESSAWSVAATALSRLMLTCGDMALADGQTEYWRGIRDGLNAFFFMTDSEANLARFLIDDAIHKYQNEEKDDEEIDNDASLAISHLGSSPL